jgi:aryl-alcohol dehydrogenase-like predicted oxidoreductase
MITTAKTFTIGNDLEVNRLGFGAMRLTGKGIWGEPKDPEEARRVLKRAVELGVNFIDTADSYGPDVSERLIGETLSPFPKGLVVATKGGLTRQGPDRWSPDGRPDYLAKEVEKSLRLLKTDVIDLWQLHRIDPKVPVEQSLEPIVKLKQQGKIRHIGLSEVSQWTSTTHAKSSRSSASRIYTTSATGSMRMFSNTANATTSPSSLGSRSQPASSRVPAASWTKSRNATEPRSRNFP